MKQQTKYATHSPSIPVKEGQDEGLDITPGEWYISESIQHDENMCPVPYYEIANKNSSFWIAQINASDIAFGKTQAENNAKAICTAVNSTYGKNLNPAAMEELYKALDICRNFIVYNIDRLPDSETVRLIGLKALNNAKTIKP